MACLKLIGAISVAYPVAVCCTLFFFQIFCHIRGTKQEPESGLKRHSYRLYQLVWAAQALTGIASLALAFIDGYNLLRAGSLGSYSSNGPLASNIALTLYFLAGLLPDPDKPFRPCLPNFCSWLVAIAFEISLLVLALLLQNSLGAEQHGTIQTKFSIEVLRCAMISIQCTLFCCAESKFQNKGKDEALYERIGQDETGSYGSISKASTCMSKDAGATDAQAKGWLNYFLGFQTLFPYFWPSDSPKQQVITLLCFGLLIAQRVINVMVPYQLGVVVVTLGYGHIPYRNLALYCLYRLLQGQQGILGSVRAMMWIPISQSLFRRLTCAAYEHVMMLSLDFHLSKKIGEVISALSKGGALNTFLDGFAFQLFPMVFDLGVAAVYLFVRFNTIYSVITVSVLWGYIFITIYMAKYRGRARRVMAMRDREMEATKTDTIMAFETVHQNSALHHELLRFTEYVKFFQKAEFTVLFSLNVLNAVQNSIFIFGVALVVMLSAFEISVGTASVASFVTIVTYFAQLQAPLAFFGSFYNQVQNNLVDAERMLDLFNKVPDIKDSADAKPLNQCEGLIEFKNVSFSYNERKPALKNVSFTVRPGTTTALVGESGSGKSTCMKLIFRFYDVQDGSVELDGCDVRVARLHSLRQNIGVVPQDTMLFNESLMYNIKYGRPQASDAEAYEACRAASIHSKILSFPDAYHTKIAIARAILKNPSIMLLDEATASLDSQTEALVQDALSTATRGRTTVTIAHRLSTITRADQILVMHAGEIVERGTHKELLVAGGRYAAMWEKQTRNDDGVVAT